MKELKFRAWHKKLKCWGKSCIGIDFDKLEATFGLGVRYLYFHNKEIDELPTALASEKVDILNAQDKVIIVRYTGLKDKNGKKIYEGDIVRYSDRYTAVVVWKHAGFELDFIEKTESLITWYYLPNGDVLEVLGNIYENPELIVFLSDDV